MLSQLRGSRGLSKMTAEQTAAILSAIKGLNPANVSAWAIKNRLNGDKDHGWGQDDSLFVLEVLWLSENGDAMPDTIREQCARFINPSACRQYLEGLKLLNKSEGKKGSKAADELAKALAS
jgi:hypothetical protein